MGCLWAVRTPFMKYVLKWLNCISVLRTNAPRRCNGPGDHQYWCIGRYRSARFHGRPTLSSQLFLNVAIGSTLVQQHNDPHALRHGAFLKDSPASLYRQAGTASSRR